MKVIEPDERRSIPGTSSTLREWPVDPPDHQIISALGAAGARGTVATDGALRLLVHWPRSRRMRRVGFSRSPEPRREEPRREEPQREEPRPGEPRPGAPRPSAPRPGAPRPWAPRPWAPRPWAPQQEMARRQVGFRGADQLGAGRRRRSWTRAGRWWPGRSE